MSVGALWSAQAVKHGNASDVKEKLGKRSHNNDEGIKLKKQQRKAMNKKVVVRLSTGELKLWKLASSTAQICSIWSMLQRIFFWICFTAHISSNADIGRKFL